MSKIITNRDNDNYIIINKIGNREIINQREFNIILEECSEFIPKLNYIQKKKKEYLEYIIINKIPLSEYLKSTIDKKGFINIVTQIINILNLCKEKRLFFKNLVVDMEKIFIDMKNKKLFFIYWPVINSTISYNVEKFLEELPYKIIFNSLEDTGYVTEYIKFFKSCNPFSLKYFERILSQIKGENLNISNNILTGVMDKGDKEIEDFSETILLCEEEEENLNTVLLEDTEEYVYLIRSKNDEKIAITNPVFKIGKDKKINDYVINDNNAVSRVHAEIISKDNKYYIVDKKSTNGTFINDIKLEAYIEEEIKDNYIVKLGNEEFIFCQT